MSKGKIERDAGLYVGYLPAPQAHGRFARITAAVVVAAFGGLALLLGAAQGDAGRGTWDASGTAVYEGTLRVDPYPVLLTTDEAGGVIEAVLVDQGKIGATARAAPFDGQRVRVKGGMIRWGARAAIELAGVPDDVSAMIAGDPAAAGVAPARGNRAASIERVSLIGEIVDPKCYLGVMNPGHGKPHLSCAELCIRGGIPPVLVVRTDAASEGECVLLVDAVGKAANEMVRGSIGQRVRITGARAAPSVPGGWGTLRVERIERL